MGAARAEFARDRRADTRTRTCNDCRLACEIPIRHVCLQFLCGTLAAK
jgi:hypothetical protein